jgi:hypothetical protein
VQQFVLHRGLTDLALQAGNFVVVVVADSLLVRHFSSALDPVTPIRGRAAVIFNSRDRNSKDAPRRRLYHVLLQQSVHLDVLKLRFL